MSADQGDPDAQFAYGMCLKHGGRTGADLEKAAEFFKLSADQGHELATTPCIFG
jgi:TPR repeat protein